MKWSVAVLAAGKGTRMRSVLPKVLHRLAGRALLDWVLDRSAELAPPERTVVVVGHGADQVAAHLAGRGFATVLQEPQLGTGDAVRTALGTLPEGDAVLVLSGDVPLLKAATLARLRDHLSAGTDAVLLTAELADPGAYGRIVRAADGGVEAIVEARDADPPTRAIREVNAGIYAFRRQPLERVIAGLRPDNDQGEYYLTDVVAALRRERRRVAAVVLSDPEEMLGVNTRADLARVARILNRRTLERLMDGGVTVADPETTWIEPSCEVGRDVVIEPGVVLRNRTRVGAGARIGAHAVLDGADVPPGAEIPPLAHLTG